MADDTDIVARVRVEGIDDIGAQLNGLAAKGQSAFEALRDSISGIGPSFEGISDGAEGAEGALDGFGKVGEEAFTGVAGSAKTFISAINELSIGEFLESFKGVSETSQEVGEHFGELGEKAAIVIGAITAIVAAGIGTGAALFELARSGAEATVQIGELATAAGATSGQITGIEAAFAAAGASTENFAYALRALAIRIQAEWPDVVRSIRDSDVALASSALAVREAQNGVAGSSDATASSMIKARDAALALEAAQQQVKSSALDVAKAQNAVNDAGLHAAENATNVRGAELALARSRENLRVEQGGAPDKDFEAWYKNQEAINAVAAAEEHLAEAQRKQQREALEQQTAELALANAKRTQAEANDKAALAEIELSNARRESSQAADKALALQLSLTQAQHAYADAVAKDIPSIVNSLSGVDEGLGKIGQRADLSKVAVQDMLRAVEAIAGKQAAADQGVVGQLVEPTGIQMLYALSDAMSHLTNETQKIALARAALGRGIIDQAQLNVLQRGSEALRDFITSEASAGFTMDGATESAEHLVNAFDLLWHHLTILKDQVSQPFWDMFTAGLVKVNAAIVANRAWIVEQASSIAGTLKPVIEDFFRLITGEQVKTPWLKAMVDGAKELYAVLRGLVTGVSDVVQVFGGWTHVIEILVGLKFLEWLVGVKNAIKDVAEAIGLVNLAKLAAPRAAGTAGVRAAAGGLAGEAAEGAIGGVVGGGAAGIAAGSAAVGAAEKAEVAAAGRGALTAFAEGLTGILAGVFSSTTVIVAITAAFALAAAEAFAHLNDKKPSKEEDAANRRYAEAQHELTTAKRQLEADAGKKDKEQADKEDIFRKQAALEQADAQRKLLMNAEKQKADYEHSPVGQSEARTADLQGQLDKKKADLATQESDLQRTQKAAGGNLTVQSQQGAITSLKDDIKSLTQQLEAEKGVTERRKGEGEKAAETTAAESHVGMKQVTDSLGTRWVPTEGAALPGATPAPSPVGGGIVTTGPYAGYSERLVPHSKPAEGVSGISDSLATAGVPTGAQSTTPAPTSPLGALGAAIGGILNHFFGEGTTGTKEAATKLTDAGTQVTKGAQSIENAASGIGSGIHDAAAPLGATADKLDSTSTKLDASAKDLADAAAALKDAANASATGGGGSSSGGGSGGGGSGGGASSDGGDVGAQVADNDASPIMSDAGGGGAPTAEAPSIAPTFGGGDSGGAFNAGSAAPAPASAISTPDALGLATKLPVPDIPRATPAAAPTAAPAAAGGRNANSFITDVQETGKTKVSVNGSDASLPHERKHYIQPVEVKGEKSGTSYKIPAQEYWGQERERSAGFNVVQPANEQGIRAVAYKNVYDDKGNLTDTHPDRLIYTDGRKPWSGKGAGSDYHPPLKAIDDADKDRQAGSAREDKAIASQKKDEDNNVGAYASGGLINGSGGDRDDSNIIRASHGEYVIQAPAVRHAGVDFMHAINSMQIPRHAMGGMVRGATRVLDIARTLGGNVSNVFKGFAFGGLVDGSAALSGVGMGSSDSMFSSDSVSASSGSDKSSSVFTHQLDLRTNAGTFSVGATDDMVARMKSSSINSVLSSTGTKQSWWR